MGVWQCHGSAMEVWQCHKRAMGLVAESHCGSAIWECQWSVAVLYSDIWECHMEVWQCQKQSAMGVWQCQSAVV